MLSAAGVAATGDERLGIYVGGRKVSGSAQCVHRNRAMYHCTLLYDTDLKLLNTLFAVAPSEENIRLHPSVRSVRSEVTNLKEYFIRLYLQIGSGIGFSDILQRHRSPRDSTRQNKQSLKSCVGTNTMHLMNNHRMACNMMLIKIFV